jgi:oligosaccharide repeat unit polymerase
MSWISIVCFSLFFLLLLSLFKKGTDIFSPARIFLLVWTLSIGVAELKFSRYQIEWTLYSWMMLLLTLTSFLVGIFAVYSINSDKNVLPIPSLREKIKSIHLDSNLLLKIIYVLFALYILSYLISYIIIGYFPLFSVRPSESRVGWGLFGFGLLNHMSPPILFFIVVYWLFTKGEFLKKLLLIPTALITMGTNLFLLHRFDLVLWLIVTSVFLFYATEKMKFRNVILLLILFVGMVYGISALRLSRYITELLYILADMKFSVKYAYLTEPYMYISMNLENFANGVDRLTTFDYGFNTFNFLLALSGLQDKIFEYAAIKDFPHLITSNYNTYTSFFVYYKDFGVFGLGFIPFFIGAIISGLHKHMRKKPSINSIAFYGMFVFAILFTFFVNVLTWLHFMFNLGVIYIVSLLLSRREVRRT